MMHHDIEYARLLSRILLEGEKRTNRTGVETLSLFGERMEFPLYDKFPLLTGKRVHWKSVLYELLWFLRGEQYIDFLHDNGVTIWDEWADQRGYVGPSYGYQWRSWPAGGTEIDQLANVVRDLRRNPDSRRHIVSAWNVGQIDQMALPPCHLLFQFNVSRGEYLDCQMYQRSCDMFLGVPFNIASYAALTHLIAHTVGLKPGRFIWVGGDCHVYVNHKQQCLQYLERTDPPTSPTLRIVPTSPRNLNTWRFDDFVLEGYNPMPTIRAEVAV